MVAETSAWGRAIVAALAADTKKGIASADEVRVAKSRQQVKQERPAPANAPEHPAAPTDEELGWQSSDEEKPVRASTKQVQRIQIMRQSLPNLQDDEVYHAKLLQSYGVISTKDLTQAQAANLIDRLQKAIDGSAA
jgi:hypothetical protein